VKEAPRIVTPNQPMSVTGIRTILMALKDIDGISGSFAVGTTGALVARDMPSVFDDGSLSEAGERLVRMGETLADIGDQLDLAVIRFQDHKVYLKVLSAGMLCVLAHPKVNVAALRMAVNLVGRRITPVMEQLEAEPPNALTEDTVKTAPPTEPPRPVPGAHVASAGASAAGQRRFRGRTIG